MELVQPRTLQINAARVRRTVEYTEDEKREQDRRIYDALAASDYELQTLVDLMFGTEDQGESASFGITLSLPSGVIAGLAITRKAWSERVNETLRGAGEGGETLADSRERVSEIVEPKHKEARAAREAEDRPLPPRAFIHLKDAELKSGGQTFNLRNARVDLTHVSAWDLGSWTPTPA